METISCLRNLSGDFQVQDSNAPILISEIIPQSLHYDITLTGRCYHFECILYSSLEKGTLDLMVFSVENWYSHKQSYSSLLGSSQFYDYLLVTLL